jgi:Permuted papain-like amidase enzyme, YaeF/YiiX, C92 family
MKMILKNIKISSHVFLALFFSIALSIAHAENLKLREGDIIGESEIAHSPTTAFFEAATASRYGHVGVVLKFNNDWYVYEETPPKARMNPLETFLKSSAGPFTVIRRQIALDFLQVRRIKAAAQDIVNRGVPYNHSQTRNKDSMNCSEFTHTVFAAAGIQAGQVQKIQDMNLATFHGYPWALWQKIHPETKLDDEVITPASVMRTSGWFKVEGTLVPSKHYSDIELIKNWKNEHALEGVATLWRTTPADLEKLAQP